MKFFYSEKYEMDIGPHVFPMVKYRLIHDKLIKEKIAAEDDFVDPGPAEENDVLLVHTKDYVNKLKTGSFSFDEIYKMELPYKKEMFGPGLIFINGSIQAAKYALENGVGIHIGGGFHHAYPDHGEGFCIINDHSIAIRRLQKDKDIKKAAVIDCDLHQGNGTAKIFQGDDSVFTFSIHQENNYPYPKEKSDLDVGLEDGVGDLEYNSILQDKIPKIYDDFKPDLVCYLAGADPYEHDQLGALKLTIGGLKKRDEIVISEAKKRKIPFFMVYGGGYAQKVEDTITIHTNTIKTALV